MTRLRWDSRNYSEAKQKALAWRIHGVDDIDLPPITDWNDKPCDIHKDGWQGTFMTDSGIPEERTIIGEPNPSCRKCGIVLRAHQRVGALWMYYGQKQLLADTMGAGKTAELTALVGLMKETGELGPVPDGGNGPAIIIPRAPALHQWRNEMLRVLPHLKIIVADAPAKKRHQMYMQDFDVLLIGPETLRRDYHILKKFNRSIVITDDVDQLRNAKTQTSICLDALGEKTNRYIITSGTPLQKRLPEIHQVLDGIGGNKAFGSLDAFTRRYCRWDTKSVLDPRTGERNEFKQIVGYKNLGEFKELLAPFVLRRTAKDLHDVKLPVIQAQDVMLNLYPSQRAKYVELQKGVIKLLREEGDLVKQVTALTRIHYGAAICAGLATLGEEDGPGASVKLDWIMENLDGDLSDEKVVVFAKMKTTVRALQHRLKAAGVGFVTVWGEETNKAARMEAQNKFWDDPNCRVLIGTAAIEQSLNLQVSRHLINIDMILNPARMAQLAGRIRRQGSAYSQVFVHNLITEDTQEERYLELIETEAALADHVWNEDAELFKALPPKALLQLIAGR